MAEGVVEGEAIGTAVTVGAAVRKEVAVRAPVAVAVIKLECLREHQRFM